MKKTDDKTLIAALRILVNDIQSQDGIANACIAEAADRLEELTKPAMTMYDFLEIVGEGTDYKADVKSIKQTITALQSAGVLNVKGE